MKGAFAALLFLIALAVATPAYPGVKVTIGQIEDSNKYFLIKTGYNRPKLDGGSSAYLDTRLMQAPGSQTIPVNFYNPLFFNYVYATAYHPACVTETKMEGKMPWLLRTVAIETFHPVQWRDLMKTGKKIQKAGHGIKVLDVISHLQLFVEWYLPAMDEAGKDPDLRSYLPLFQDLVAYTKETSPKTAYNDAFIDGKILEDAQYAAKLHEMEQQNLLKLDGHLKEISALLSLNSKQRITLRWMQANMFRTKLLYHNLMTDKDRQIAGDFLEQQHRERNAHRRSDPLINWVNKENGLVYSLKIGSAYQAETQKGSGIYQECVETTLQVDLSQAAGIPLIKPRSEQRANFCRQVQGWQLRLIGAENL